MLRTGEKIVPTSSVRPATVCRWLLCLIVVAHPALLPREASAQPLFDTCADRGGNDLCVAPGFTAWCYTTDINPPSGPPSRHIGFGLYQNCYGSEEEAIAAFYGWYTLAEITDTFRPWSDTAFLNNQASGSSVVYSFRCIVGPPGRCGTGPFGAMLLSIGRTRTTRCSIAQSRVETQISGSNIWVKCVLPGNYDRCPVGNPIHLGEGRKTQSETDYLSPSPGSLLSFSRFYDATAALRSEKHSVGNKWSSSLAAAVSPPAGTSTPGASPAVQYINNAAEGFRSAGTGFEPFGDARGQLFREVDGGGATVAWNHYGRDYRLRRFSPGGLLERETGVDGKSVRLTYSGVAGGPVCRIPAPASGLLWCMTDDMGRQLDFEYDAQQRLVRVVDPAAESVRFTYDEPEFFRPSGSEPVNLLTTAAYPDGTKRHYHYNEAAYMSGNSNSWSLTGISVEVSPGVRRRVATFQYDFAQRARSTSYAGGANAFSVNHSGSTRQVTDPLGTVRTHSFSYIAGAFRQTSVAQPPGSGSTACNDTVTYDPRGNVSSRVDFKGNKTCYAYDLARNLETKRVEGLASSAACSSALSSPPSTARVISTEWHPDWRMPKRIAEPQKITSTDFNGHGGTCAPAADPAPAVVCSRSEQATTDENGATGFSATPTGTPRTWTYTYTTFGRVLSAIDPHNKTTTYTYHSDDDPDLGKRGNLATLTNASNHVTRYTEYNAHGQSTRVISPNGLVTVLTYDTRMRIRTSTAGAELTRFTYDHPTGQLTEVVTPDGTTLSYGYDDADRLTSVVDHKGNRIDYTLDPMGNRIAEQTRDPGGQLVKNIGRLMDAINRVRQLTGAVQ